MGGTTAEHFEIGVVGGGNGGKTLAAKMASSGRRVVMIEKGMTQSRSGVHVIPARVSTWITDMMSAPRSARDRRPHDLLGAHPTMAEGLNDLFAWLE